MATTKTDAQRVTEYRKQAQDTSLPQPVRDQADKMANDIEKKSVEKSGVKLAKGGAVVVKAPAKKPAAAAKKPMGKAPALVIAVGMGKPKGKEMMAKGGAVKKKC